MFHPIRHLLIIAPIAAQRQALLAERLPRDRTAGRLTGIGIAHFFNQRFDEAAATLLVSLEELPAHATPYRFLASCYAHMGRLDQAREVVRRLRLVTPVVVPCATPYRNAGQRELFLSGLRLAAGETV